MRIQGINNQSFGKIILQEDESNRYEAKPIDPDHRQYKSQYSSKNLIDGVIDSDYDTFELRSRYNELIAEQKNNPVDIVIDLFYSDVPVVEDFFQRATVGDKVFEQPVGYWPGIQEKPTTIGFLEKACNYANRLAVKEKGTNKE